MPQKIKTYQSFPVKSSLSGDKLSLFEDLFKAIKRHDIDSCRRLISEGAPLDVRESEIGFLPLDFVLLNIKSPAYAKAAEEIAIALVEAGAPVAHAGSREYPYFVEPPLYPAIAHNLRSLVKSLISHGALLNQPSHKSSSPLRAAIRVQRDRIFDDLIEASALSSETNHKDIISFACSEENEYAALKLLHAGISADKKTINSASEQGMETLIKALLSKGQRLDSVLDHHVSGKRVSMTAYDEMHTGSTFDMYKEVMRHLIVPALLLEGKDLNIEGSDIRTLLDPDRQKTQDLFHAIAPAPDFSKMDQANLSKDQLARCLRPLRLSRTWHHHGTLFPHSLLPLRPRREWKPILPKPYETSNGLFVHCLTSTEMLKKESDILRHCVGRSDYDAKCCNKADPIHILSIRDADGTPLSTVEVKVNSQIQIIQHHGKDNGPAPPEALAALEDFVTQVTANSNILAKSKDLGEIPSLKLSSVPKLWRDIGFEPSWHHLNKCFDEYKMPYRRARKLSKNGKSDYDDTQESGYTHKHHFIEGWIITDMDNRPVKGSFRLDLNEMPTKLETGQKLINVRQLDARSWLRATGMMDFIYQEMDRIAEKKSLPKPERNEDEPLTLRAEPIPKSQIRRETVRRIEHDAKRDNDPHFLGSGAAPVR